jgi:sensor histidine kinase YesM
MNTPFCDAADPRTGRTVDDFHPLEIIPFFRRWRPNAGRDLLYTLIWNCALGVLFWAIGAMFRPSRITLDGLASSVVVANGIGYTIHALFFATGRLGLDRRIRRYGTFFTTLYYTLLSTVGVVVGFALVAFAFDPDALDWILQPRWIAVMGTSSGVISIMIAAIYIAREREWRAQAALGNERLRIERAEREATLANLRALQAQIEPHFLFNTLANVSSLIDPDPKLAKRMLETFIRFLRASLAATRSETTTLGAEAELIAAYLEVLEVRMGPRLAVRVDVAPGLQGFALPPMLLQPIVENAIRHGLEPRVEGGEIAFRARREGEAVVIEIADTGVGFQATTRGGMGLANVRDRQRLLYGDRASLAISDNKPQGTVVTLRLPA